MWIPPDSELPATCLADWLELYALSREYQECPVGKLWDAMELSEDSFPGIEKEDVERDKLLNRVCREFEHRRDSLADAYPFEIQEGGQIISHKGRKELKPGMLAYDLSLRISIKSNGIIADGALPDITLSERNLFQSCANLAAAGYLKGWVYAFGWPRPDHTSLLEALKTVEGFMGEEGEVMDEPPSGAPSQAKDDELDVFAWLPHCDGPGWSLTLWGQVASGQNWQHKPLSSDKIEQFRRRWYKKPPVLSPIRAMFVPFCLFEKELEKGTENYKAQLLDSTAICGIIFHRYRLPRYVQDAFNDKYEIEGLNVLSKEAFLNELLVWWDQFRNSILDLGKTDVE